MSELLKKVYASAPDDLYIIRAIDIDFGFDVLRLCDGYENLVLAGNEYTASSISISLPRRSTNGQQNLTFGIFNATGEAQKWIERALEENIKVMVTVYEYLNHDLSVAQMKTAPMAIVGGEIKGMSVRIEASFQDLLNEVFPRPRQRYTSKTAPGIQYT